MADAVLVEEELSARLPSKETQAKHTIKPPAEHATPAMATPRLLATPRPARTIPTTPSIRPMITSGQARIPMNGMNERTRPTMPSTSAAVPNPLLGGFGGGGLHGGG